MIVNFAVCLYITSRVSSSGGKLPPPPKRKRESRKKGKDREREREREVAIASGGGEGAFFCTAVQVIINYLRALGEIM